MGLFRTSGPAFERLLEMFRCYFLLWRSDMNLIDENSISYATLIKLLRFKASFWMYYIWWDRWAFPFDIDRQYCKLCCIKKLKKKRVRGLLFLSANPVKICNVLSSKTKLADKPCFLLKIYHGYPLPEPQINMRVEIGKKKSIGQKATGVFYRLH